MPTHTPRVGAAAITENLLKRKWSANIMRYLDMGINDPAEITKREPGLPANVLSERLRTMLRYTVIARFPRPSRSPAVEYRLTLLGKKLLEMLNTIDQLDQQFIWRNPEQSGSQRALPEGDQKPEANNLGNPAT